MGRRWQTWCAMSSDDEVCGSSVVALRAGRTPTSSSKRKRHGPGSSIGVGAAQDDLGLGSGHCYLFTEAINGEDREFMSKNVHHLCYNAIRSFRRI